MKSDIERHHYYPLFLDITGRECVVIGGGSVAERKVMMLLKFNASVTVISPKVTKRLSLLGDSGVIRIIPRKYRRGDIDSAAIVFACTDERPVNTKIREDAGVKGTPVNVVDKPLECDFIVPSIIKKGDITIAISTSGLLPMASKKIRQAIEKTVTADYVAYTRVIGAFRKHLLRTVPDGNKRRTIMRAVSKMEIRDILNAGLAGMKEIFGEHIK